MKNKVIILGNDHTNTLGLLYSFYRKNIECIAMLWGRKTGMVKASKKVLRIFTFHTVEDGISVLLDKEDSFGLHGSLIIAGCDEAALAIGHHQKELSAYYKLPYSLYTEGVEGLLDKSTQVSLAKESGFTIPKSWELSECVIPNDVVYPCIIKPLVSSEGSKADLIISHNEDDLKRNLYIVLSRTHRLILQQYIEKDYDFIVHGVALSSGDVIIPTLIRKDLIYPKNVGLSSFCTIMPLNNRELQDSICRLLHDIKYVGLFSVEFIRSKYDGKLYFCEINLRNDGKIAMITKAGINLPYILYCDYFDINHGEEPKKILNPQFAIWEMHHFRSLLTGDVSICNWIRQLWKANIFMVYDSDDKKPIIVQFYNCFIGKLLGKKYY